MPIDSPDMTPFAQKIDKAGFTQSSLARLLGCSQTTVFYWCSGRSMPSAALCLKLAKILRMTPGKLLALFETTSASAA